VTYLKGNGTVQAFLNNNCDCDLKYFSFKIYCNFINATNLKGNGDKVFERIIVVTI
jgi:hypothetical protein